MSNYNKLTAALVNYINARAERLTPCKHEFVLIVKGEGSYKLNPQYTWSVLTYFCEKCGTSKQVSTAPDS